MSHIGFDFCMHRPNILELDMGDANEAIYKKIYYWNKPLNF